LKGKQVASFLQDKRIVTPIINPDNPNEVYTLGKHPAFLIKLMAETGKTVTQLREESEGNLKAE
jgi:hypothetical protein